MYIFLQQYWWLVVSLLGAILVFLLFVQGGNSLLFCLGKTEEHRKMMVNSTGRKWEFTFTTLVTFGGAFFASFPLFYSTSFGGAYWLWMIILFSFVLQAVSYEFQSKAGNLLGKKTYRTFLVINGVVGPVLLGGAVATFFTGSDFYINKANMTDTIMPVISHWGNAVRYWMQKENIPLENVLIVVDDLALPFGTLRLKGKGSDAGHNGLKHIAATLGTQNYARLRFGIGNDFPRGGQVDFVLGHFTDEDWKTMDERLKTAGEIIKSFCLAGIDITMNQFNKK